MKNKLIKLFSLLFVLFFALVIVGCKTENNNDEKLLEEYYNKLQIETVVEKDFDLPYSVDGKDDHKIVWGCSDPSTISIALKEEGNNYLASVTNKSADVQVTIIASIKMNSGLSKDKEFTVTVKSLSIKDKYECISIAEAIEIANQAGSEPSAESYYIYGIIVKVTNPTYGEMTITDGENELYVYGTKDENDILYGSWTGDKPVAGDEVVLYGKLKMFNGTPEMDRSVIKDFKHIKQEVDEKEYASKTVAEARVAAEGTKMKLTGIVATVTNAFGFVPNGFFLIDDTGAIYVYGSDTAQQVSVGNKVTIACEKTYYVNPDEASFAQKYEYKGANQVQNVTLLENDKGNHEFNKSIIEESTVKDIIETDVKDDITSNVYKVTALINKVPGSGFTNYYINDLDGKTGSYVYTMCNGNDFTWLDQYDGKICTVYLSPINCKATAAGTIYRFIPVLVENNGFTFDLKDACEHAVKYYAIDQFKPLYQNDPSLELITSVSSELLGFENVVLSYSSSNTNVVYFENNLMHTKDNGEAKVTITAKYNDYTFTAEVTVKMEQANVSDYVNVKTAIEAADDTKLKVQGVVVASVVNQTAFYIGDETGVMAVSCSADTIAEIELGNLIVVEGTKIHRKKDPLGDYAGQIVLSDATLVVNYYGNHEYSKESFITGKTLKDVYDLAVQEDHSASVYVVKGTINFVESQYYTSVNIIGEGMTKALTLYCSSGKQYNWLKELANKEVTVEIAPCNWNGKSYYAGCIISVTDGTTTLVNNLNFQ